MKKSKLEAYFQIKCRKNNEIEGMTSKSETSPSDRDMFFAKEKTYLIVQILIEGIALIII